VVIFDIALIVNRIIGAKLKAELEGNAKQVTCMDKLSVNGPNAYEIAFFMITS